MGVGDQRVEVGQRAEQRIDAAIVGDVVAEIGHRRGEDRRQPDRVDAEPREVIEPLGDALEVADAVAVGVLKRARIDLIEDAVPPPSVFVLFHRKNRSLDSARQDGSRLDVSGLATRDPKMGSRPTAPCDAGMTAGCSRNNAAILSCFFPWRSGKNRHCADMTQETETKAKAGAIIVPVTLFEQNCTMIWCEATRKAVVIDPGGDVPKIQAAIEQTGVTVEKIWLTHGHIDHVGGAAELRDALKVSDRGPAHRRQIPARQCRLERRALRHDRRAQFRTRPLAR